MLLKLFRNKKLSDEELIEAYIKSHKQEYVAELLERYTHLVFGVCMKYLKNEADAQDAVVEIYEQLLQDLLKHKVDNFSSWLHTKCRNYSLMKIRKTKSLQKKQDEYKNYSENFVETSEDMHLTDESDNELLSEHLNEVISELKEEQKICIQLFYLQEKSYKEIVEITQYDMKKVKSYIQNGKRKIKIELEKKLKNKGTFQ